MDPPVGYEPSISDLRGRLPKVVAHLIAEILVGLITEIVVAAILSKIP